MKSLILKVKSGIITILSKVFCQHKWTTLRSGRVPCRLEVAKSNGFNPDRITSFDVVETHYEILWCTGCGKIKKFAFTNE